MGWSSSCSTGRGGVRVAEGDEEGLSDCEGHAEEEMELADCAGCESPTSGAESGGDGGGDDGGHDAWVVQDGGSDGRADREDPWEGEMKLVDDGGYESHESWAAEGNGSDGDEGSVGGDDDVHGGGGGVMDVDGEGGGGGAEEKAEDEATGPAICDVSTAPPDARWLHDIHREVGERLGASVMEGGVGKTKIRNFGKRNTDYRPFPDLTTLLLMVLAVKHQLSRVTLTDLFKILHFVDGSVGDGAGEGRAFEIKDVPTSGEHFVSRMREYLPLYEVWVRETRCKPSQKDPGAPKTVNVYDIPITHVMDFLLRSRPAMEEVLANPGGAVLGEEEAESIGLASEHKLSVPTRPEGNRRRNAMHGTIVQTMPHVNTDGFLTAAGTKAYVGDVVMCDLRAPGSQHALQVPCRVVRVLLDEPLRRLVVGVRCFRNANEVHGTSHDAATFRRKEVLVRVWEELGPKSEIDITDINDRILDLIEVFTAAEIEEDVHLRPWNGAGQRREGWSFAGEGFVELKGNKFVPVRHQRRNARWRRAGGEEENYPNMRRPGVLHNTRNLPTAILPVSIFCDDFAVFNINTPVSDFR